MPWPSPLGLGHTHPDRDVAPNPGLSCARPHDVRVRRGDRERPDPRWWACPETRWRFTPARHRAGSSRRPMAAPPGSLSSTINRCLRSGCPPARCSGTSVRCTARGPPVPPGRSQAKAAMSAIRNFISSKPAGTSSNTAGESQTDFSASEVERGTVDTFSGPTHARSTPGRH